MVPGQAPGEEERRHLVLCPLHWPQGTTGQSRFKGLESRHHLSLDREATSHGRSLVCGFGAMFTIYRYAGHIMGSTLTKCGGRKKRDVPNRGFVQIEVSLLHSNKRSKRSSILHDWLLEPAPALLNLHVFTFHQSETASTLMNSICLNSRRTREENWESVSSSLSDRSAGPGQAKSQEAVPGAYGSFLSSSRVCTRSVLEKWEGRTVITSAFCP